MKRLFIACWLPEEIADLIEDSKATLPGVKFVDYQQLHLTIRFIGDVDGGTAKEIEGELDSLRASKLKLFIKGMDFFGKAKSPRTLYAKLEGLEALMSLKAQVDSILSDIGIAPESKPFKPHITIARIKKDFDDKKLAVWMEKNCLLASPTFSIDSVHLIESQRIKNGVHYQPLSSYPLTTSERERLIYLMENEG